MATEDREKLKADVEKIEADTSLSLGEKLRAIIEAIMGDGGRQ